ncbi:hypothetical protein [Microcoleus sp. FACHB-68]|uniref:hypothetical protein n=1 Tax=Microcoleus sp. FACHB-68 TaxID=2692826 RepID=UPI001689FE17|nr:hypothetical protein [Microcoleus sp. FACHB-68]MBD1939102.1 hypothetical protein [Microcoleus sp. FACHB-68]
MNTLTAINWEALQLEDSPIPHIDELVQFVRRLDYEPNGPDIFDYLDDRLKSDGLAFVRQGIALARMCRFNLFQHRRFRSFKEYCQKSLNKSVSYCNRLMEAAALVLRLINLGFSRLPANESQCRPLTKIAEDWELREKWQLILDISDTPSHKGIVTASLVADIMEVNTGKQSVRLSPEVYKKLQRISAGCGKSIDELIDAALDAYSPDEEEEPAAGEEDVTVTAVEIVTVAPVPAAEKMRIWLADLADLISDHCDPIRGEPAADSS